MEEDCIRRRIPKIGGKMYVFWNLKYPVAGVTSHSTRIAFCIPYVVDLISLLYTLSSIVALIGTGCTNDGMYTVSQANAGYRHVCRLTAFYKFIGLYLAFRIGFSARIIALLDLNAKFKRISESWIVDHALSEEGIMQCSSHTTYLYFLKPILQN
jgi:hypothetical protein